MIYNLEIEHEKQQATTRFHHLVKQGKRVELKVKHPRRSIKQNSYLHLLFQAFGLEFGYSSEEVKQYIFKEIVNPEIFNNGETGNLVKIQSWRSTADLDTSEMTISINRFLNYSATNGYRLPEPSDLVWIEEIEKELSKNREYL